MRPSQNAFELPSYATLHTSRLPTYDEQWDDNSELNVAVPQPAHLSGRDTFAGPRDLESGLASTQLPLQAPIAMPAAPRVQAQANRTGCCRGVSLGVLVAVGFTMTVVGAMQDSAVLRDTGIGLSALGLIVGATLHARRNPNRTYF